MRSGDRGDRPGHQLGSGFYSRSLVPGKQLAAGILNLLRSKDYSTFARAAFARASSRGARWSPKSSPEMGLRRRRADGRMTSGLAPGGSRKLAHQAGFLEAPRGDDPACPSGLARTRLGSFLVRFSTGEIPLLASALPGISRRSRSRRRRLTVPPPAGIDSSHFSGVAWPRRAVAYAP